MAETGVGGVLEKQPGGHSEEEPKKKRRKKKKASAETGGHAEEAGNRAQAVRAEAVPSGPIGEEEAKKMGKKKRKKASAPTDWVADPNKRMTQGKKSGVHGLAESAQSPLTAIGLGGLEGLPAELKSLTGQYLNGGMNVDDLDVLASAMTDGLPDEQMETAFNEMLFERVMKSKLTGAPVETLKRGNGSSDNKKKKIFQ